MEQNLTVTSNPLWIFSIRKIPKHGDILGGPIARQGRERDGTLDRAQTGSVPGRIAAGLLHSEVLDGAIAQNGEGDHTMQGAGISHGWIEKKQVPVGRNSALRCGDVPRVARLKFSTGLLVGGDAASAAARSLLNPRRDVRDTAVSGNCVWRWRCFAFKDSGLARGGEGLFLGKFWNGYGFGLGLRYLGRLFLVKALGRINRCALRYNGRLRHGKAGAGH